MARPIKKALSRGYRNRNPGNIRKTEKMWIGEVAGSDKEFKTFKSMSYGYRAVFALLREYINKGYDTIEKIINRYAPPIENETTTYVQTVSAQTKIPKDKPLTFADREKMYSIVGAISYVENGVIASILDVDAGYKLLT